MTHIQWTDETWNCVSGCTRISPGCDHCYIERTPPFRMAGRRFDGQGIGSTTGVTLHPERLAKPLGWRKPRRVFVNSLADLFHEAVPDEYIVRVYATMAMAPRHTFQVLTKRPARMRALLSSAEFQGAVQGARLSQVGLAAAWSRWPLPNVWAGVSVESQKWADKRIPILAETPAAVRWLSCEPLLSFVNLQAYLQGIAYGSTAMGLGIGGQMMTWGPGIDWVVVGGESGPGARPMDPDWARSLVEQCRRAEVPVFVKQLGAVWASDATWNGSPVSHEDKKGGDPFYWPADLRVREYPAEVGAQ